MLQGMPKPKSRKRPGKNEPVMIGDCQLYLGDCLEILPALGKVDAVVTDPPFNAGKEFANDSLPPAQWAAYCARLADALLAVRPINLCIEVGKNDAAMRAALDARFQYRWALALNYTNAMRNGAVGYANFGLVLWYGGKCFERYMDRIDAPLTSTLDEFRHPSPKEVAHYSRLISMFSPARGTILDPFMGSGTTGVACVKLGRKFIGVEIEPRYFDIACKRIEKAYSEKSISMSSKTPLLDR